MAGVLSEGHVKTQGHGDTGECHVKTEAETGVMHSEAKECQGFLATTRSEEEKGRLLPRATTEAPRPFEFEPLASTTVGE